ncbi:MAG: methyltransferase domain-containing protein [Porticoccaceae bacterium]
MSWVETIKNRYRVAELVETQDALEEWFATPFAARMLAAQRRCCETNLSSLSGYRLGHLGVSRGHDLTTCFDLRHRFKLAVKQSGEQSNEQNDGQNASSQIAGIADFETLPLPSDAIDVMVLHHVLDFSSRPHEVLNEVARVVTAGGHLVIVGFNPLTVFGLARWPGVLVSANPIWRYHSLRLSRVIDWLTLLGFEVTYSYRGFSEPDSAPDLMTRARGLTEVHRRAFYVLAATKRVAPLSPLTQPNWLPVRLPALAGNGHASSLPNVENTQKKAGAGNTDYRWGSK